MFNILSSMIFVFFSLSAELNKQSLIDWKNLDHDKWFELSEWKKQLKYRQKTPYWEQLKRERLKQKLVAIVLDKVGTCLVLTENSPFKADYRSKIYKGYEIETKADSICWVMLIDGSLIRLAPNSSISINEFKMGNDQYFFFFRLNNGNIYFATRPKSIYKGNNLEESDNIFLPPSEQKARIVLKKRSIPNDFLEKLKTTKLVYEHLNKKISLNNKNTSFFNSRYLFTSNMATFDCRGEFSFESYINWGRGILTKRRNHTHLEKIEPGNCTIILKNKKRHDLRINEWLKVSSDGKSITNYSNTQLGINEYLTSNIPSVFLSREYLVEDFLSIFNRSIDRNEMLSLIGHTQYDNLIIHKRYDFLINYVPFIEGKNYDLAVKRKLKPYGQNMAFSNSDYFTKFYTKNYLSKIFYKPYQNIEKTNFQPLNSTKKKIWKLMHERRTKK